MDEKRGAVMPDEYSKKNEQYILVGLDIDTMTLELLGEMRKVQTLLTNLFKGYFDFSELDELTDRLNAPEPAHRHQALLTLIEGYNDAHNLLELLEDAINVIERRVQDIQEIVVKPCTVEWSIVRADELGPNPSEGGCGCR